MVNRFKDSIDAGLTQKPGVAPLQQTVNPNPSQVQVQTVIDSYQQQMKEFKNTVNDLDRKLDTGFGGQSMQEEIEEGYATMGAGDRITTFRTEMMSKDGGGGSMYPPSIQVSQVRQQPLDHQNSKQMNSNRGMFNNNDLKESSYHQ